MMTTYKRMLVPLIPSWKFPCTHTKADRYVYIYIYDWQRTVNHGGHRLSALRSYAGKTQLWGSKQDPITTTHLQIWGRNARHAEEEEGKVGQRKKIYTKGHISYYYPPCQGLVCMSVHRPLPGHETMTGLSVQDVPVFFFWFVPVYTMLDLYKSKHTEVKKNAI